MMGLESVNGIWDLNRLWPLGSDRRATSDDHHRIIKDAIRKTFLNISATITLTDTEFNYVDGLSTNLQAALDGLSTTIQVVDAKKDVEKNRLNTLSASIDVLEANVEAISAGATGYFGICDNGSTGGIWPTGWSLTRNSSGDYSVVHGVGEEDGIIQLGGTFTAEVDIRVAVSSANGFSIYANEMGGTAVDVEVYFDVRFG